MTQSEMNSRKRKPNSALKRKKLTEKNTINNFGTDEEKVIFHIQD